MTNPPIGEAQFADAYPDVALMPEESGPTRKVGPVFIGAYWFAQFGNWIALLSPVVISIALRVAAIATPEEKAAQLGIVLSLGAFGSLVATPLWGQISDRTRARIGRRKLWMIVGVFGGGLGLLVMSAAPNMLVFGAGWLIAQITFNANQAALNALLPDQVPAQQRGRVSGLLGLSAIVAILAATFLAQYTAFNPYVLFLGPWLVTVVSLAVLLFAFKDRPAKAGAFAKFGIKEFGKTFWVSPRKHKDFAWAFLSRFLVFLGVCFIQVYSVYLLTDRLGVAATHVATLVFLNTLIGAAITVVLSPLSGLLSDKLRRRKPFVLVAGLFTAVGLLLMGFATSIPAFFVAAAIANVGSAVYYAVDLALVAAVLPDPENSAKDMGVFNIASTLPQSLAPAIAPAFLAIGSVKGGNYVALFTIAAIIAVVGSFAIAPVRRSR